MSCPVERYALAFHAGTFLIGLCTFPCVPVHGQVLTFEAHYDSSKNADFAYGTATERGTGAMGAIVPGGKFASAAHFDANAWYTYNTAGNIFPNEGTIFFWAKKDTLGGQWQCLFSLGTSDFWTPVTDILFRTEGWVHGYVTVSDTGGAHSYTLTSNINSAAEWNHFALTWKVHDTNKIDLVFYTNGEPAAALANQDWNGFAFGSFFAVGGFQAYSSPNACGMIDDLGIVGTALSDICILGIYSSATPLPGVETIAFAPGAAGTADEKTVAVGPTELASRFEMVFVKPNWSGYYGKTFSQSSSGQNPDWFQSRFTIDGGYGTVTERTTQTSATQIDTQVTLQVAKTFPLTNVYISIYIPISVAQTGGHYSVGGGAFTAFPATATPGSLVSATTNSFAWSDGAGRGLRITLSGNRYVQLQDNRQWGLNCFELMLALPLGYPDVRTGTTTFTYSITPLPCVPERPFVDPYGQSNHRIWPGKVTADSDLVADIQTKDRDLALLAPPQRDPYGGWSAGPHQTATGFFRTQKIDGRWWLIDPDGNLFFSVAADWLTYDTFTVTENRSHLFEWLPAPPPHAGTWADAWMGYTWFSHYTANLIRKYTPASWAAQSSSRTRARCLAWGFNASSAWSANLGGVPYTTYHDPLSSLVGNNIIKGIPGATPDIFDPAFLPGLDSYFTARVPATANDPYLIGHYIGNEQPFEGILSVSTLDGTYYTKQDFVNNYLAPHYNNSIAAFNSAWAMSATSFSQLINLSFSATTATAQQDMEAYLWRYMEYYATSVRAKILQYDPNHLLLGCRLLPSTAGNPAVAGCLGAHMDVFSVNYYTDRLSAGALDAYHAATGDKPMILSEWSYGCTDRGHSGGVRNVANQRERGYYYRDYIENAAARPYVVGCDWFEYTDQAITGRPEGGTFAERHQTGLVDVTDRPYAEVIDALIKTNYRIYDVAAGRTKPFRLEDVSKDAQAGRTDEPAKIYHRTGPIEIDGGLHEWLKLEPSVRLTARNFAMGSLPKAKNIRADVWLQWDDRFLYVAARVSDPTPLKNLNQESRCWNGDGIELFFSNRLREKKGPLQPGDWQVLLNPGCDDPHRDPSSWLIQKSRPLIGALIKSVKKVNPSEWSMEARIPISNFDGFRPAPDLMIDFDAAVDNNDTAELDRTVQLVWYGGESNHYTTANWGRARLLP